MTYSSGTGGVGGRSRIVNGGGVCGASFLSRIRSGCEKKNKVSDYELKSQDFYSY